MTPMRWIEDNPYDPAFGFWTRANVGEVLPAPPSPLGWDLVFDGGVTAGWRDCMIDRLGMGRDEVDSEHPQLIGIFGGYAYLGATMMRIWAERTNGFSAQAFDDAYFAGHPDVPVHVPQPWHIRPATTARMDEWLGWVMGDMDQSELEADRSDVEALRDARPDLTTASERELLDHAMSLKERVRSLFSQHINQSYAASIGPGALGQICAAIGRPDAVLPLLSGFGDVDSANPSYRLWELSRQVVTSNRLTDQFDAGVDGLLERLNQSDDSATRSFLADFRTFLVEYGSRGPNEWDLNAPAWEQAPDYVLAAIDSMRSVPDESAPGISQQQRNSTRRAVQDEVRALLADDPETAGLFDTALASCAVYLPGRERSKANIIRAIGEIRVAVHEIGRRAAASGTLDQPSDAYLLFVDELSELVTGDGSGVRDLVAQRRRHLEWLASIEPPFIIAGPPPPNTTWPLRASTDAKQELTPGDVLTGIGGCSGIAHGRARVVHHPSDPAGLQPGEILIAPMTDPSWTPLFVAAAGIVVNVGSPLSHAVIVSRELGTPCVVSANAATTLIRTGMLIEIDGSSGTVTALADS